jgi:CobQ-like glutamine amidotransferase family enzyme
MKIKIAHLYPDVMNLYGDYGNIITLTKRCEWRNINVEIISIFIGDKYDFSDVDLIFLGGGQDSDQLAISSDLLARRSAIKNAIESDAVALTICGGYQLFGKYFSTHTGTEIPGIDIFNAWTIASNTRMIGNALISCEKTRLHWPDNPNINKISDKQVLLVGFENHSGRTFLGESCMPLGSAIIGYGNDGTNSMEGCRYRQAFGTYLHGSLLPKNPWFADYLISIALQHRYKTDHELVKLNDSLEKAAQEAIIVKLMDNN